MLKKIKKISMGVVLHAKNIIFADPKLMYEHDKKLIDQSFFFNGSNKKGVLLVHGWTSTPYEVRRLGKYLNENGYTTMGIKLAGHGTVSSDLEKVIWQDWLENVRVGYFELKKTCDQVYIAGTSIGGDLALIFAEQQRDVSGLILMATPYQLRFEKIGMLFVQILLKMKKKYRKKFYPPTFGLSTTITRLISYQTYPTKSLLQAFEVVCQMRKNISNIVVPVLIMQSTHDHIIQKNSMENIFNKISSKVKKKIYIKKAYHTFISDIKNEHIFEDILNFIEKN
ncbi:MAG: alpha/beta fold hydrolase [bacterium]